MKICCISFNEYEKMHLFTIKPPKKIPLKPYMDFSVIYYIKWSVVAIFSVNPMHSVNPMSVKVMHHCISVEEALTFNQDWMPTDMSFLSPSEIWISMSSCDP